MSQEEPEKRHPRDKITRLPQGELTGKQKRQLRSLAHELKPIVHIGKDGATDDVLTAIFEALLDHELIKVKVLENAPRSRKAAAPFIALRTGSHVAGEVGRIVILYRAFEKKRGIRLAKPST